jgi:acyl-coenzyme A thioesterase PaaI-like protein
MEWPLANTIGATETLAQANYPEIRMFRVEHHTSAEPLTDLEGHWVVTTPDEACTLYCRRLFLWTRNSISVSRCRLV